MSAPAFVGLSHIGQVFSLGWAEKFGAAAVFDFDEAHRALSRHFADAPQRFPIARAIRQALVERVVREGPIALVITTTGELHAENETRMLSYYISESQEQTRGVIDSLAAQAAGIAGGLEEAERAECAGWESGDQDFWGGNQEAEGVGAEGGWDLIYGIAGQGNRIWRFSPGIVEWQTG